MKTIEEQIVANVDEAREVATIALKAAKAALLAYQHSVNLAQATVRGYSLELSTAGQQATAGRDFVTDALDVVERLG